MRSSESFLCTRSSCPICRRTSASESNEPYSAVSGESYGTVVEFWVLRDELHVLVLGVVLEVGVQSV